MDEKEVKQAIDKIRKKYHLKALDSNTICNDIEKELKL